MPLKPHQLQDRQSAHAVGEVLRVVGFAGSGVNSQERRRGGDAPIESARGAQVVREAREQNLR